VFWFVLTHFVAFFVDLVVGTRPGNRDRDRRILVLRHQVRLLQRQRPRPPRLTRGEKLTLAVLTAAPARLTAGPRSQFDQNLLLFKPDTILKWHRELVRRTWTYRRTYRDGRPTIPVEVDALIVRLARENPHWGHRRIQGALGKLGHAVSASAVRAALRRHRVPPAPQRRRATTWREFINRHQDQLLACDCCTVATLVLKARSVLFSLAVRTRRVHLAGCTAHPAAAWVTQQARQRAWTRQDAGAAPRCLHPRSRRHIPARLRCGARGGGGRGGTHALPHADGARLRRALGRIGARGVPRSSAARRGASRTARADRVHRPRRSGAPAPRSRPAVARTARSAAPAWCGEATGCARWTHPRIRPRGGVARCPEAGCSIRDARGNNPPRGYTAVRARVTRTGRADGTDRRAQGAVH